MSFFKKIKGFLNIEGLKLEIKDYENPFPFEDSAFKGTYTLKAGSDLTVLLTKATLRLEYEKDGLDDEVQLDTVELGSDNSKEVNNLDQPYPFEMKAGEEKKLSFIIVNIDILKSIAHLGYQNKAGATVDKGCFKLFLRVDADAKGTPFDPSDTKEIELQF